MDKNEVYEYVEFIVRYTCTRVGAPELGIERTELLAGIQRANPEVHSLVMAFLDAYWEWFKFTNWINEQGRGGKLDGAEFHKLDTLTKLRDETRKQLVGKVNSLPPR